jgi:hypothetical protein
MQSTTKSLNDQLVRPRHQPHLRWDRATIDQPTRLTTSWRALATSSPMKPWTVYQSISQSFFYGWLTASGGKPAAMAEAQLPDAAAGTVAGGPLRGGQSIMIRSDALALFVELKVVQMSPPNS